MLEGNYSMCSFGTQSKWLTSRISSIWTSCSHMQDDPDTWRSFLFPLLLSMQFGELLVEVNLSFQLLSKLIDFDSPFWWSNFIENVHICVRLTISLYHDMTRTKARAEAERGEVESSPLCSGEGGISKSKKTFSSVARDFSRASFRLSALISLTILPSWMKKPSLNFHGAWNEYSESHHTYPSM